MCGREDESVEICVDELLLMQWNSFLAKFRRMRSSISLYYIRVLHDLMRRKIPINSYDDHPDGNELFDPLFFDACFQFELILCKADFSSTFAL
jgi:hypothetical protein